MLKTKQNKFLSLPSSNAWLIAALDPFHDYQYDIDGLPDEKSSPSVVQVHNQVYTLTAPTSAAANWDASVTFTGLNSPMGYPMGLVSGYTASSLVVYDSAAISSGAKHGTLNIRATSTVNECFQAAPVELNSKHDALGSYENASADACRLIGVGIEITNTTAEIYKQGSVTVAMLPDSCTDIGTVLYHDKKAVAPEADMYFQSDKLTSIPSCASQLRAIPGSSTWAAKDGVYMIPRLTTIPRGLVTHPAAGRVNQFIEYDATGTSRNWCFPQPILAETYDGTTVPNMYNNYVSGFTPMQAFFTGLSQETTLTITMRTIVEYFPPILSPLLPLASPSAPYDAMALQLYSRIIVSAPYAVPVRENALGDYFRKILAVIKNLAPIAGVVGEAIIPGASAVGSTVGTLADKLIDLIDKKNQKKQQAAPLPPRPLPRPPMRPPNKPLPPIPVRRNEAGPGAMATRGKPRW